MFVGPTVEVQLRGGYIDRGVLLEERLIAFVGAGVVTAALQGVAEEVFVFSSCLGELRPSSSSVVVVIVQEGSSLFLLLLSSSLALLPFVSSQSLALLLSDVFDVVAVLSSEEDDDNDVPVSSFW